jgi:hypothetical protein
MVGPKLALFIVLVIFVAMVMAVGGPVLARWAVTTVWLNPSQGAMTEIFGARMVGVVQGGALVPMHPYGGATTTVQLTRAAMQTAPTPESGLIDLSPYEGQAIIFWGHNSGGWIYSAQVEGVLDPVSALLVRWGL